MNRPFLRLVSGLLLASALTGEAAVASGSELTQRRVGEALAKAAVSSSPLNFLDAVRREGIPAGLVLHFETWNEIGHQVTKPAPSEKTSTLADAIDAFRAAHPEWVVSVDHDGVVIRDSTVTPRDERFSEFRVEDETLFHAFARAQALIDPEIPTDQGIAFMGPASVDAEVPSIDELASQRRVSIALRAKSFEQILNSLAAIDPGTGWVLIRHQAPQGPFDTLYLIFSDELGSDQRFRLPLPKLSGKK